MLVENAEPIAAPSAEHRSTFFRQSGWMMTANLIGGFFMWAVHFLSRATGPDEYGLFVACLAVAMCIPTIPLQMVMAQQTAQALATNHRRQLAGMIRLFWVGSFLLWLPAAGLAVVYRQTIITHWEVTNPAALWLTLPVVLLSLWMPLFAGVLQGQQNFLWLGWSMIFNAVGRVAIAAVAVLAFRFYASGMMTGVLFGLLVAMVIGVWQTKNLWTAPSLPFDWRTVLKQIIPLMLGFAAFQVLFTADTMFAKSYFDRDTVGFYGSAGVLSRALMWLVGPLAAVMFPRIVHSAARSEKTDLVGLVFLGTAILSVLGAIALSIIGPYVVEFVSGEAYVKVASALLPWYAGAMVPLALANVLLNNLLARSAFSFVPALCVLVAGYVFALTRFHDTPVSMLKTMACFNLGLLVICAWFTWGKKQGADRTLAAAA